MMLKSEVDSSERMVKLPLNTNCHQQPPFSRLGFFQVEKQKRRNGCVTEYSRLIRKIWISNLFEEQDMDHSCRVYKYGW